MMKSRNPESQPVKASGNKILVECDLPTDYVLSRIMLCEGLPMFKREDSFYVITKDKKIYVREYLEDGFSYIDSVFLDNVTFSIKGNVNGGMGMWEISYRIIANDGVVNNIYELNSELKNIP